MRDHRFGHLDPSVSREVADGIFEPDFGAMRGHRFGHLDPSVSREVVNGIFEPASGAMRRHRNELSNAVSGTAAECLCHRHFCVANNPPDWRTA